MQISFVASLAKDTAYPEWNEDVFLLDEENDRIALSDGASESFDSKTWAHLLCDRFIADPFLNIQWIDDAASEYRGMCDYEAFSWAKQLAFERGSFATLLGVEINRERSCLEILAVGDSLAILVDGPHLYCSWPYQDWRQFDTRPVLLSTTPAHNQFVGEPGFYSRHQATFNCSGLSEPTLICVTDAVGRWALRSAIEGGDAIARLLSIDSQETFETLIEGERGQLGMRADDSTLIVMRFD